MTKPQLNELRHIAEDLRMLQVKYADKSRDVVKPRKKREYGDKAARYRRQREAVLAALAELDPPEESGL